MSDDVVVKSMKDATPDELKASQAVVEDLLRRFGRNAPGAMAAGTRVVKINADNSDAHFDNDPGTVIGSIGPIMFEGRMTIGYFVEWDNMPGIYISIVDRRIKKQAEA